MLVIEETTNYPTKTTAATPKKRKYETVEESSLLDSEKNKKGKQVESKQEKEEISLSAEKLEQKGNKQELNAELIPEGWGVENWDEVAEKIKKIAYGGNHNAEQLENFLFKLKDFHFEHEILPLLEQIFKSAIRVSQREILDVIIYFIVRAPNHFFPIMKNEDALISFRLNALKLGENFASSMVNECLNKSKYPNLHNNLMVLIEDTVKEERLVINKKLLEDNHFDELQGVIEQERASGIVYSDISISELDEAAAKVEAQDRSEFKNELRLDLSLIKKSNMSIEFLDDRATPRKQNKPKFKSIYYESPVSFEFSGKQKEEGCSLSRLSKLSCSK